MLSVEDIEKLCGSKISDVTELDLSGKKLKRVDPNIFQKLPSLLSLNLSNNELRSLPSCLGLQCLQRLDVSDNCLQTLEFVEQMPRLEEMRVEGNGLQLADKFMAIFLCPRLATIDGKSADQLKTAVKQCRNKFWPVIESCWLEHFADTYANGLDETQLDSIMQSLVQKVKARKLFCPGVPPAFRDFMIDKLSTNLVISVSNGSYKAQSVAKTETKDEVMKDENSNESAFKFNPCPEVADYNPTHFMRCHFCDKNALKKGHTDDDPTDEVTNVWYCMMEPDPLHKGKSTGIVATCGGDIVCLIDCSTGQVMKRYKEPKQEFYCLAWTTLTLENDGNKRTTNILAVGGFNSHLRLLHPDQLVCYGHHGTGRPNRAVASLYYSCMVFHPNRPTWLFCGSSDTTVTLFDIGVPHGTDYKVEIKQLLVLTSGRQSAILNLIMHASSSYLVAGTENGCFAWDVAVKSISDKTSLKRREPTLELNLPINGRPFIDGLVMIDNTYMACKCVNDGFIYVVNLDNMLQRKSIGKVYGFEWVKTEQQYLSLGTSSGLLGCGDDKGNILLYNIKPVISSRKNEGTSFLSPSKVLLWPECNYDEKDDRTRQMTDVLTKPAVLLINKVCISSDLEYIVAVTDCNLVCVWRKAS